MKASWQALLLLHYYYFCTGDVHGEISDAQGETPQTPLAAVEENIVMTQQRDKSWKCVDRNVVTPRYATPVPSATARATALQTSAFSDTFLGSASVQGWIKETEHFAAAPRTDASRTSLLQILMQSFWSPRRRKKKKKQLENSDEITATPTFEMQSRLKKKHCWPLLDPIRVAMSDERTLKGPYYSHN